MKHSSISRKKQAQVLSKLAELGIKETDIECTAVTGSGKGGQKQSSSKNCAQLYHKQSDTHISCHETRSLAINTYKAYQRLYEILAAASGIQTKQAKKIEKMKKQKKRRKRRSTQGDTQ
ncbi:peptide chain release factor-like protein [bacterium]|nr:peptide chain release factor-like protein [bacterium]